MGVLRTKITPVTFDGHLGALHRPCDGESSGVAVVICPPLGYDARCAYRALFSWAEALASTSFPVLRYDPLGEGDSGPLEAPANQLPQWIEGAAQAAEFVRTYTGARQVVIAGLRMGATLALAAASRAKPDGLILLAPLITGRAWLQELRLAAAVQKLPFDEEAGPEVHGLHLSPETVRSLGELDARQVAPVWRAAFLATPGDGRALAARLGPAVTVARFEGYGSLFKEPYLNQTPTQVLAEAAAWLDTFASGVTSRSSSSPPPAARLEGEGWVEHPVSFGHGLRGVVCLPRRASSRRAILMGNTGADPRAGVGAFATHASRALASEGVASLRFDFPGMGESAGELVDAMDIYDKPRVNEFRAAAALLQAHGYDELTLVGVCTGGFQAVRTVIEAADFRRAVAFNSWLVPRREQSLDLRSETAQPRRRRSSANPDASLWSRISRGEIDPVEAITRKAKQAWSSLWPDAQRREFQVEIRRAGREGAEIHLLLGRGDVALRGLEADFGPNCGWLRRQQGVSMKVLSRLDHALFSKESQEIALRELFRIVDPDAGNGSAPGRRTTGVLQAITPQTNPALGG